MASFATSWPHPARAGRFRPCAAIRQRDHPRRRCPRSTRPVCCRTASTGLTCWLTVPPAKPASSFAGPPLVGRWGHATLFMGSTPTQGPAKGWVEYVNACYKLELIPVPRLAGRMENGI